MDGGWSPAAIASLVTKVMKVRNGLQQHLEVRPLCQPE
jgi:hypothetical protein